MNKHLSLDQSVRKDTFSKLIPIMAFSSLLVLVLTYAYLDLQIHSRHESRLAIFTQRLEQGLNLIENQAASLAKNDLIVNSIVDKTNRELYLPVLFRSLRPGTVSDDDDNFSIVFLDFEGKIITGNNEVLFSQVKPSFEWKETVLRNDQPMLSITDKGVLAIHPVIYGTSSEGAIAIYLRSLNQVVPFVESTDRIVVQYQGKTIYTSDWSPWTKEQLKSSDIPIFERDLSASLETRIPFQDLDVIFMESYAEAYGNLAWVLGTAALVVVILSIAQYYSAGVASGSASRIIAQLSAHISAMREGKDLDIEPELKQDDEEPNEISFLRESFNALISELFTTSKIKNRIEGIIDSINELLVVYSPKGETILYNKAFEEFCRNQNILPSESARHIFPKEMLNMEKETGHIDLCHTINTTLQRKRYVSWRKTLYRDVKDDPMGIVIAGVDVTQSVQLQQDLRIKNLAVDEAQTPILIANAKEHGFPITYVNAAFEKQTGYSFDDVHGKSCRFLQGPGTAAEDIEAIREALRNLSPVVRVIKNYKKDGTEFFNKLTLTPIRDDGGSVTHFLGFQQDITEQKRTQAYLEQAREKAEENAKLKSEFLASMSHEIRTPMNGILGMLGLLQTSDLTKQQSQHVNLAKSSADALLVLINEILDFSKIEAGKLELENEAFNLVELLGDIMRSIAFTLKDKDLEIILDTASITSHTVVGDPGRIRQIINNLVGNAIKFTETGFIQLKASTLVTYSERQTLRFEVTDTGVGIASNQIHKIFDSFSQADASPSRRFGGTGLGLTICKQLAEMMHGDIKVSSQEGVGSTFTFEADFGLGLSEVATPNNFDNIQALVFYEHEQASQAIANQFGHLGVETYRAPSFAQLMRLAKDRKPDLVLLRTPESEGDRAEMLQELRTTLDSKTTLVLLATFEELKSSRNLEKLGAQDFIALPVTESSIIECILAHQSRLSGKPISQTELPSTSAPSASPDLNNLPVLLVEDNPVNQVLQVALLERFGLDVTLANNGKEALEILSKSEKESAPFRLIFMDCQMPEMDGYETTRNIRRGFAGESYADIPILALTANAISGDREKCLASGMSDYMSKPIDIDLLKEKVEHWSAVALGLKHQPKTEKKLSILSEASYKKPKTEFGGISQTHKKERDSAASLNTSFADIEQTESASSNSEHNGSGRSIWNRDDALVRTLGNESLMNEVVGEYLEDIPKLLRELQDSAEQQNLQLTCDLAHTIKGASLNISAVRLSELAEHVEKHASRKELKQLDQSIAALCSHFRELEALLKKSIA